MEFYYDEAKCDDLKALRQLYGLLQSIIGCDNLRKVDKLLDKKAIVLLKKLLDDATQRLISKVNFDNQLVNLNMQDNTTTKSTGRSESRRFSSSSEFSKEIAKSIEQIDSHILSQQITFPKKHHEVNGFTFNAKPESESSSQCVISYVNGFRVSTMVNQVKYSNTKLVRNSFTFDQHHVNPVSRDHSIKSQRRLKVKPNHRHEIIVRPMLLDLHENRSEDEEENDSDGDENEDSENTEVYDDDDEDEEEDDNDTDDDDNTDVYDDEDEDEDEDDESDDDNDEEENDDKSDDNSSYGTAQSQNDETEYYSPRRRISRLRRIKNKLGLIFAHHRNDRHDHHHHDHDHDHDHDRRHRDRSTWKVLRGIFPHGNTSPRKRVSHTSVVTGRSKPSAVVKRNQHGDGDGNFRSLTVGMMRRVGRKKAVLVKSKRKKVGLWRGVGVKMGNYGRKGRFNNKLYKPPKLKM